MRKIVFLLALTILSTKLTAQISDKPLFDVYSTNSHNAWFVGAEGIILHTEDGGVSWIDYSLDTTLNLNSIYFSDENNGFIVGDSGLVLRTTDGGTIWNVLDLGADGILSKVEFVDSQHGWILDVYATDWGIYRTTDGGGNWEFVEFHLWDICMIDSITGWGAASIPPNYTWRIVKTIDGGLNWFQISNLSPIGAYYGARICFADSLNGLLYYAALGWPNLAKTIDGGITWTGSDDVARAICFSTVNNVWIGWLGVIRYSNDFCQTFDYCDIGNTEVNSISAYGPDNGWAVGGIFSEGYVWKLSGTNDWVEIFPANIEERKTDNYSFIIYPNPTSNVNTMSFELQEKDNVSLSLYTLNGQLTNSIFSGEKNPGTHQFEIDCRDLAKGIYLVKLQAGKEIVTKKLIVN